MKDGEPCTSRGVSTVLEGVTPRPRTKGSMAWRFLPYETMSPFVVKHVKEKSIEGSNAKFTWGVKNGTELQKILPNFSILHEVSLVEGMKELMPVYCVIGKIPAVRNISNKIIVMEKRR